MKSVEAIKILHGCDLEGRILFRSRELGALFDEHGDTLRSTIKRLTADGILEFVHTDDDLDAVKRGIIDRMPRNRLPIATEERCLHDLVSRKRSLELIDWDEVDAD